MPPLRLALFFLALPILVVLVMVALATFARLRSIEHRYHARAPGEPGHDLDF